MIVYASRTGNVRYIASHIHAQHIEISSNLLIHQPYLLMTYTDGLGEIPLKVEQFLENNAQYCKGVVVSGNRNFGHKVFAAAGDVIAKQYSIPIVRKVDLRGYASDYEAIQTYYETKVTQ